MFNSNKGILHKLNVMKPCVNFILLFNIMLTIWVVMMGGGGVGRGGSEKWIYYKISYFMWSDQISINI